MRAAGLKYDADGKVAWDEIWGSFCDLAMAGGPPHKGKLLAQSQHDDTQIDAAKDIKLSAGAKLVAMAQDATTANGLAFSPDARTLYWADTPAHAVRAWDWDAAGNTAGLHCASLVG